VSDNQTVYFRRAFTLSERPRHAFVHITADNFFTLYVNGHEVDKSVPDPKDDNVWQHVHSVDIASSLVVGNNVIAVRALNAGGAAGLLARLDIRGKTSVLSDGTWRILSGADAPSGWEQAGFDDSAWHPATVEAALGDGPWGTFDGWPGSNSSAPYLAHIPMRPVAVELLPGDGKIDGAETLTDAGGALDVMPAQAGSASAAGVLLDFGKEVAGRIEVSGTDGGQVQVATGESREECLKSPWGGPHLLTLADGKAASPYSAFRYARVSFFGKSPFKISRLMLDYKYYPVRYRGSFDCSDPLLTKLWYMGAYTAHLCMQEDIWDAPKRDRARWIGDLHVSGDVIDNVFADKFLMEQTMRRLREDAQGGRPATEMPGSEVNGIPGYSAAWFSTLADFHRHIGDYDFLKSQHNAILTLLEYQKGDFDADNLFVNARKSWPFTDWSPGFDNDSPTARAATQMFIIHGVREAVFMLNELGDTANAAKWTAWADTLTDAAHAHLVDTTANTYSDRRQENAMAVYSGVATAPQRDAIYEKVLNPASDSWKIMATPYYNNYVIFAMAMLGHTPEALRFIRDYWGGMLAEGATTFWEGYDLSWPKEDYHAHLQADDGTGYFVSLCHGWSAGCTNFLTERVLGVTPEAGGFAKARIVPDLVDLAWAEGDVPTPGGRIHIRAEKSAGGETVTVAVPPGVEATIGVRGNEAVVSGAAHSEIKVADGYCYITVRHAGRYTLRSQK
jgi:hypothetical protein